MQQIYSSEATLVNIFTHLYVTPLFTYVLASIFAICSYFPKTHFRIVPQCMFGCLNRSIPSRFSNVLNDIMCKYSLYYSR